MISLKTVFSKMALIPDTAPASCCARISRAPQGLVTSGELHVYLHMLTTPLVNEPGNGLARGMGFALLSGAFTALTRNPAQPSKACFPMTKTIFLTLLCLFPGLFITARADDLTAGFQSPPDDTRPGCYWYFFKDDVTRDGITKDLEAMARVGIGRAFIGYINQGDNPVGDNQVLSEKWWKRLEHTFLEADRLGIDIGLFNCPGWSQSGGPWITPNRSMRNLVNTEVRVTGPADFDGLLPAREGYFETVKVLAFPAPPQEKVAMADYGVRVKGPGQDAPESPLAGGGIGFRATLRQAGDPGNPSGLVRWVRVRNGAGKTLFEDDFSGGLGRWRDVGASRLEGGLLHPIRTDNPPMRARRVALSERFSLETSVKLNPGGVLGLALGIKDSANYAFLQLRKGLLRPHLKRDNQYEITDVPVAALVENQWMDIRVTSDGDRVRTYVDGALVNALPLGENTVTGTLAALFDGQPETTFTFPGIRGNKPFTIDFTFDRPYPVQSIIATPTSGRSGIRGVLLVSEDGKSYRKVSDINLFHGHQGVKIADPMVAAVPATTSRFFRLQLTGASRNRTFTSLELSPRALLDKYVIKQLGDIHDTPHPMYGTYEWTTQGEPALAGSTVAPARCIDLTDKMDADGHLRWSVPEGDWVIARFAMVSTGSKNGPAMPDATGLECDKMSAENIRFHFDNYIGKVLERILPENRKRFKYIIQDSYETGPQNWTDGFIDTFRARYHYDPVPYLPVTTGRIVGSADRNERFLWDLRRLVADRIGSEYVGGLTAAAEERGLIGWLENYGHWGFPGEFLTYGKQSTEVAGEFWLQSGLGTIENRPPASCAHIYGKPEVYAEAFTSGIRYIQSPQSHFKHYGDWAFAQGINHFIFHVYIHQPRDERPGVNAWFGTNFNRNNTWFEMLGGFVRYTQRVNYMMRRGTNVADVAYFIGEGAPKMDGPNIPPLPRGYDFDFVNGDVILNRMTVENGRIRIPDGPSYKVLVLPPVDTMRPEIAAKLKTFVEDGAVVVGPRPVRSPSLENYPACDVQLAALTEELWGKGLIRKVDDLAPLLLEAGVTPDFAYTLTDPALNAKEKKLTDLGYASQPQGNSLRFAHRREGNMDIYFVANMQTDHGFQALCSFRVGRKQPEIWDPVTGEVFKAQAFTLTQEGVTLPMRFAPKQSWLFVFRDAVSADGPATRNAPALNPIISLDGSWTVRFDPAWGGPATALFPELVSWTDREEEGIKYYSGEAVYETSFMLDTPPASRTWLNLGRIADLGEVTLNGKPIGNVWVEPWRIEVTGHLEPGRNTLRVKVANTWNNRILGDKKSKTPYTKYYTAVPANHLLPAGLLGPVTIEAEQGQ